MKGFLYWAISFRFIPNFVIFSNQFAINFHSKPHASKGVYRYHFMTYSTVIQTKTYSFHVSALRKFIYDKTTAKKRGSLSESVFLDVERTYAVHFLLATCNVRPMTTPEFFPQKPVSNYWQLIQSKVHLLSKSSFTCYVTATFNKEMLRQAIVSNFT